MFLTNKSSGNHAINVGRRNSMEDILRLLNERERQSADAFDNFSKTEPNNIDDWRQGYMYGLKEGRLREIKDIKEMVLKNR